MRKDYRIGNGSAKGHARRRAVKSHGISSSRRALIALADPYTGGNSPTTLIRIILLAVSYCPGRYTTL